MQAGSAIDSLMVISSLSPYISTRAAIRALVKSTPHPVNHQLQSAIPIDIIGRALCLSSVLFLVRLLGTGIELGRPICP